MPTASRLPRRRTASRRLADIGTIVPLAIGLTAKALGPGMQPSHVAFPAMATVTASTAATAVCEEVIDTDDCHSRYPAGCNGTGRFDATLNFLKNRVEFASTTPRKYLTLADFGELEAKVPSGLGSRNHKAFVSALAALGEGDVYGIIGYLYPSKAEGAESSNCMLERDDADVDFHLYIGFDSQVAQQLRQGKKFSGEAKKQLNRESVIAEMTPHYRSALEPTWTFERVSSLIGQQVRVVGQLMIDNEHNLASQNCGRPDAKRSSCWRASVWELHPVIDLQVCPTAACSATSSDWRSVAQATESLAAAGGSAGR